MDSEEKQVSQENLPSSPDADSQKLQKNDSEVEQKETSQVTETFESKNKQNISKKEIKETEIDKDLYDEILEKLDIKRKENGQDISKELRQPKDKAFSDKIKNLENIQIKNQVEKVISQDFAKIQNFLQGGLINSAQEQFLKKQVLQKAFDKLVQTEKIKRTLSTELKMNPLLNSKSIGNNVFEEFSKSNPDFFTQDGRKDVLNYLKSDGVTVGKEELNKISGIIRTVEKAAIDRYLQKAAHEKTLRDSNETAKQRLIANAQKSNFSGNLLRSFTREQIGKMSSTEFAKYESAIMDALKKGQIK